MPASITISILVNALVRQELQGKGREKEALHFHFDMGMAHYTNNKTYSQRRGLHLLYHLNPKGTYISVFSAVTPSCFTGIHEVEKWTHEVTHDCCWANDIKGISGTYFDMAEKINAALKRDNLPEVAPAHMSEHNGFLVGAPVFEWVPVEVTKDPEDDNRYRRLIKVLE